MARSHEACVDLEPVAFLDSIALRVTPLKFHGACARPWRLCAARGSQYRHVVAKYEDLIAGDDGLLATTGRAWVFGDHITGNQLLGDAHLAEPVEVAARHALAGLDPTFVTHMQPGDVIVAGLELGTDATHRLIPMVLKHLGVAAVIARSFGHFFARNAIHVGLPVLAVEETAAVKSGDRLRIDVEGHIVANLSSGDRYVVRNLDDEAIAILRAGGIVEHTRRRREGS